MKGPKQVIIYNQLERNNIEVSGLDVCGEIKTPMYNEVCGFSPGTCCLSFLPPLFCFACAMLILVMNSGVFTGAQYDIFEDEDPTSIVAGLSTPVMNSATAMLSLLVGLSILVPSHGRMVPIQLFQLG